MLQLARTDALFSGKGTPAVPVSGTQASCVLAPVKDKPRGCGQELVSFSFCCFFSFSFFPDGVCIRVLAHGLRFYKMLPWQTRHFVFFCVRMARPASELALFSLSATDNHPVVTQAVSLCPDDDVT